MTRTLKTLFALLFALSFLLLQFFAPVDDVCVEIVVVIVVVVASNLHVYSPGMKSALDYSAIWKDSLLAVFGWSILWV